MFPVEEKLTPATENWMSVNPSQTPHYVSPRLIQLIGISRNKQNKALHHQCCLHLSFYMPIIWALPYLPLPLFVPNIVFYLPLPSSVSLVLAAPALLLLPLPRIAMDSCLECMCVCVLSVCTECCEWPLLADWRELKMIHTHWTLDPFITNTRPHTGQKKGKQM